MMRYIQMITTLVLIVGCTKPDLVDRKMKQHAVDYQRRSNEKTSEMLAENGTRSTRANAPSTLEKARQLSNLRTEYFSQQHLEYLVAFSDSVMARYRLVKYNDAQISNAVGIYRNNVLHRPDSLSILNLQWYTLYAEGIVLNQYLHDIGFPLHEFNKTFTAMLSDSVISIGDTLYLKVTTFRSTDQWSFDFSNVFANNLDSGKKSKPTIKSIGEVFLLRYILHEKGQYMIRGPVYLSRGNDRYHYPIANEFRVE